MIQLEEYINTERIIHNWVRFLGDFGSAYFSSQLDDSHMNLNWNSKENRFETRIANIDLFMTYSPELNRFQFYNERSQKLLIAIDLDKKSNTEVKNEIVRTLKRLDFDTSNLFSSLEFRHTQLFDISNIQPSPNSEAVIQQNKVRTYANEACFDVLKHFGQKSEVRVWPHNFDTGIYCQYPNGLEQFAGYSPADEEVSEVPYFYNAFYKNRAKVYPVNYPKIEYGYWELAKWGGAILPIDSIGDLDNLKKISSEFLINTTDYFIKEN